MHFTHLFIQDLKHYGWVRRHTWQSWRNRYVKNQEELDPKIDKYLKENPHCKEGKGRYRLSRTNRQKRRAQSEEDDDEDEDEEEDDEDPLPEKDNKAVNRGRLQEQGNEDDDDQPQFEHANNEAQRIGYSSSPRPSTIKKKEVRYCGEFMEMYDLIHILPYLCTNIPPFPRSESESESETESDSPPNPPRKRDQQALQSSQMTLVATQRPTLPSPRPAKRKRTTSADRDRRDRDDRIPSRPAASHPRNPSQNERVSDSESEVDVMMSTFPAISTLPRNKRGRSEAENGSLPFEPLPGTRASQYAKNKGR